jgi:hypothetical protein
MGINGADVPIVVDDGMGAGDRFIERGAGDRMA